MSRARDLLVMDGIHPPQRAAGCAQPSPRGGHPTVRIRQGAERKCTALCAPPRRPPGAGVSPGAACSPPARGGARSGQTPLLGGEMAPGMLHAARGERPLRGAHVANESTHDGVGCCRHVALRRCGVCSLSVTALGGPPRDGGRLEGARPLRKRRAARKRARRSCTAMPQRCCRAAQRSRRVKRSPRHPRAGRERGRIFTF